MKILKYLLLLSVVILAAWAINRFYPRSASTDTVLNLSIDNGVKTFDPAIVFNDDGLTVLSQSLETLFQYHYLKRPYEVIPLLAESLPIIRDNGKTYIIKIRKNISYHPNNFFAEKRYLKAEDFIWAIKRLAFTPLKSTGTWLFEGKIKGFNAFSKRVGESLEKFYSEDLEGLKLVDDYTLRIELTKPEPNLLYFLSMNFTSPTPIELLKMKNNDLSDTLLGTGPFVFKSKKGNKYFFERFKNFHEEFYPAVGDRYANTQDLLKSSKERIPFLKGVIFSVLDNEDERWEAFKNEDIDILNLPKKFLGLLNQGEKALDEELDNIKVDVKHFSRQTSRWLGFNMKDPLVGKNKNLRFAIAHVIDYDKYLEVVTNNTSLKANSIFNPSIPGYRPAMKLNYEYNLEEAKKYLKASKLNPKKIQLTYSTRGKSDQHFKEANFIKEQLARLDIDLQIQPLTFSQFLKKGRAGKLQFWTDNWIYDYPDGENILQLLVSKNHPGINKSGYSNQEVDNLFEEMSQTLDREQRFELMYQIEKKVIDDLPWIMLMYESTYILQRKNINNFRKSFFIRNYSKYIRKFD